MPTPSEGIFLVGYCIIMPLAFVVCLAWVIREFRQTSQLTLVGISTHGEIVSRRTSLITRGRSYFIAYRFTIDAATSNEQIVTSEQVVSHKRYDLLAVGTPVEIIYLPHAPKVSRLTGTNLDNTARLRAFYYTLLLGVVWLALFVTIIKSVIH